MHITFIFGCSVTNKTVKLAKSNAEVLNWKLAKLPNSSFCSSDGTSQHYLKYSLCFDHEGAAFCSVHVHARYHRIYVTLSALIKRKTRHSSTCFVVGHHFKVLCACANVATTWHCQSPLSQPFLLETRLVDRHERTRESTSAFAYATSGCSESNSCEFSVGSGFVELSVDK